jgi:hypothetical protein
MVTSPTGPFDIDRMLEAIRDEHARAVYHGYTGLSLTGDITQEESDTWILYEALLNPAFAHHPVTIVCGLDAREQPDSVLQGSWETHPRTMNEGWSDNDRYHDPAHVVGAPDARSRPRVRPDDGAGRHRRPSAPSPPRGRDGGSGGPRREASGAC